MNIMRNFDGEGSTNGELMGVISEDDAFNTIERLNAQRDGFTYWAEPAKLMEAA